MVFFLLASRKTIAIFQPNQNFRFALWFPWKETGFVENERQTMEASLSGEIRSNSVNFSKLQISLKTSKHTRNDFLFAPSPHWPHREVAPSTHGHSLRYQHELLALLESFSKRGSVDQIFLLVCSRKRERLLISQIVTSYWFPQWQCFLGPIVRYKHNLFRMKRYTSVINQFRSETQCKNRLSADLLRPCMAQNCGSWCGWAFSNSSREKGYLCPLPTVHRSSKAGVFGHSLALSCVEISGKWMFWTHVWVAAVCFDFGVDSFVSLSPTQLDKLGEDRKKIQILLLKISEQQTALKCVCTYA